MMPNVGRCFAVIQSVAGASEQHQVGHAVRVLCRISDGRVPTTADAHQREPWRATGRHHRAEFLQRGLQRRRHIVGTGQPAPALVVTHDFQVRAQAMRAPDRTWVKRTS